MAGKGLTDELRDRGYLVVDGTDGKAHYVVLGASDDLANYPPGAVVEVKGTAGARAADRSIAALASNGLYSTEHHLSVVRANAPAGREPQEVVAAHVRRLEALRRAGIVERVSEGLWKVPDDLPECGRQYDTRRLGDAAVELRSHLPIERQTRVLGATWLDQQLIGGRAVLGNRGFGAEVHDALRQRADFLVEQGLAQKKGQRLGCSRATCWRPCGIETSPTPGSASPMRPAWCINRSPKACPEGGLPPERATGQRTLRAA